MQRHNLLEFINIISGYRIPFDSIYDFSLVISFLPNIKLFAQSIITSNLFLELINESGTKISMFPQAKIPFFIIYFFEFIILLTCILLFFFFSLQIFLLIMYSHISIWSR